MPAVILFFDKTAIPDSMTEVHFFEDDSEAIRFSSAHIKQPHLVMRINNDRWHRAKDSLVQEGEAAFEAGGQAWAAWNAQALDLGDE